MAIDYDETNLIPFRKCPREGAIIGRIIAGYGEIEYGLSLCLTSALGNRNSAFRTFFRIRGEEQRIEIADALMRRPFIEQKLGDEYAEMIGAIRWCRKLRNQFSHAHWISYEKFLYFTNMEETAKGHRDQIIFDVRNVDEEILTLQENYFGYTCHWLWFLHWALADRIGRRELAPTRPIPKPTIIPQPSLYNPPEKNSLPRTKVEAEAPPEGSAPTK
jgi:hypothetical protein